MGIGKGVGIAEQIEKGLTMGRGMLMGFIKGIRDVSRKMNGNDTGGRDERGTGSGTGTGGSVEEVGFCAGSEGRRSCRGQRAGITCQWLWAMDRV